MNYTEIESGITGREFIVAFNDNFRDTNTIITRILETLLTKIKSNDVKELKVIGEGDQAVIYYTTEDPPEDGEEDTREWKPVDTTKWGNITGDIADQADLKNILDSKAEASTVTGITEDLDTLELSFNNLKDDYDATKVTVNQHTSEIANLIVSDRDKVTSPNVVEIRVNQAQFEYKLDGGTWTPLPRTTSIPWGNLTGDMVNQGDLNTRLTGLDTSISTVSGTVTTLGNTVASQAADIDNIEDDIIDINTLISQKDSQYNTRFNTISGSITDLQNADTSLNTAITTHEADRQNPHVVTKAQVGLGNADDTADMDKPLSTYQKDYVDTQIQSVNQSMQNFIISTGLAHSLYVGTQGTYDVLKDNSTLGIILKEGWDVKINTNIVFNSTNPIMSGKVNIKNADSGDYAGLDYESDTIVAGSNTAFHNIPDGRYTINSCYYQVIDEGNLNITGISPVKTSTITIGVGSRQLDPTGTLDIKNEINSFVTNNQVDYIDQLILWIPDTISQGDSSIASDDTTISLTEQNDYSSEPAPYSGYRYACYRTTDNNGKIPINKTYTVSYTLSGDSRQATFTIDTSNIILPDILVDDGVGTPTIYQTAFVTPSVNAEPGE